MESIIAAYDDTPARLDAYIRAKRVHDLLEPVEPIRDEEARRVLSRHHRPPGNRALYYGQATLAIG